ncbi:MAG: RNA methyltransferase [Candidatus Hydrogenedentes bacterium]|nr:RNA methyltransferase [Candidatus Hydrogenedentota bacterium]
MSYSLPELEARLEPHYRRVPTDQLPPVTRNPVHVVLDNLRSAFNVGSIFRTSDAGAVEHIHLCGLTAFPPNPKLTKTALGAHEYVPWTHHATTAAAIHHLKSQGVLCVAVEVTENSVPHTTFEWPQPVGIVFGNEVWGIKPETLALCDAVVNIPMRGHKNTINVATAFGVVLYEVLRRWGAA